MQRRTLPAIALGLLALGLAGLLWWLLEPGGSRGEVVPTVGNPAVRAAPSPLDAVRADETLRPAEPLLGAPQVAQREAVELAPEPPPTATLEVRVLHASPPQPVEDAEVLFAHGPADADGARTLHAWFREGLLDARVEPTAIRTRTDANGRARIPKPERTAVIIAWRGTLWGFRTLEPDVEGPLELSLHEDFDLEVEVVDAGGRHQRDYPVSLRMRQSQWHQDLVLGRTGADGRALLRHVGYRMRSMSRSSEARWVATLAAVLEHPVEHTIDLAALPSGVIRLVAPATGSLEVFVLDARGEPYTGPVSAGLRVLGKDLDPTLARTAAQLRDLLLPESRDGRAIFEQVELGRSFEATITRRGSHVQHPAQGPGPVAAGERARLEVHMGRTSAVLTGRALDGTGTPLAQRKLRSRVESTGTFGSEQRSLEIPTDDRGHFEIDHPVQVDSPGQSTLTVALPGPAGEERLSAARVLPQDLRPGPHDLGDLVLEPPPLLAAGVVVDESGEPVAGIRVTPSIRVVWDADQPDSFYWNELDTLRGNSDAQGAFELRGRLAPQPIRLTAKGRNLEGDPLDTVVGASGLVVRVSGTGAIEGSILLDRGISPSLLRVRAQNQKPPEGAGFVWAETARLAEDGSFRIADLQPGTYTLRFETSAGVTVQSPFPDVHVRAGETTRDPRFDPLDLRGALHALTIEIVDAQGRPVPQGQIEYRSPSEEDPTWDSTWFNNGRFTLFPPSLPVDVTISVEGYLDTSLVGLDSGQRVVLERGPELRLILRGIQPPDPPYQLSVMLIPVRSGENQRWHSWGHDSGIFGPQGEAHVRSPATGPVAVNLLLVVRRGNGSSGMVFTPQPPPVLQVADQVGPQTFEIQVDETSYQEALAGLPRNP